MPATTKRKHNMPFGAECHANGSVGFRLWAPKAESVSIRLIEPSERDLPMLCGDKGWFELLVPNAKAGTKYQFIIDGQHTVPDPASRYQPFGVHGPSEVVEPNVFEWHDVNWRGRPWEEAVIYELHVGTFSPQGTYAGAEEKLDYLVELGATAVELMPISSFPGQRNWGYDGVLPYAPATVYGRPEELKHFIDSAHAKGLMVLLDVVYNHFGPEGNYLGLYASQFFTDRHHTPWGLAINFDGDKSRTVREFFIHNALYWLEEFHFDGLRLDAVHAIVDDSRPDILVELAETVRKKLSHDRQIHLVLENEYNGARYLIRDTKACDSLENVGRVDPSDRESPSHECSDVRKAQAQPCLYNAQWNDDIHHAMHVLLTGEIEGYYIDYSENPIELLGRCLAEGFGYQGEPSRLRNARLRGEPSRSLPPTCFISFLQNHDQVGNRALGERIDVLAKSAAIKVAAAIFLLAPSPPLIFMGEEFAAATPFLFFCDFGPELAARVSEGRRKEFPTHDHRDSRGGRFEIPDPNAEETFLRSKLDWTSAGLSPHIDRLNFYQTLLRLRQQEIAFRIKQIVPGRSQYKVLGTRGLRVRWALAGEGYLEAVANFGSNSLELEASLEGRLLYSTVEPPVPTRTRVPPLAVAWFVA